MVKHDEFTLGPSAASRLKMKWRLQELLCFKCGQLLKVGDLVHHRMGAGARIYHARCFETTYVDEALSIRKSPVLASSSRPD
jgi:hypothetical protein